MKILTWWLFLFMVIFFLRAYLFLNLVFLCGSQLFKKNMVMVLSETIHVWMDTLPFNPFLVALVVCPQPRIQPVLPAMEVQNPNYWTTRGFPGHYLFMVKTLLKNIYPFVMFFMMWGNILGLKFSSACICSLSRMVVALKNNLKKVFVVEQVKSNFCKLSINTVLMYWSYRLFG